MKKKYEMLVLTDEWQLVTNELQVAFNLNPAQIKTAKNQVSWVNANNKQYPYDPEGCSYSWCGNLLGWRKVERPFKVEFTDTHKEVMRIQGCRREFALFKPEIADLLGVDLNEAVPFSGLEQMVKIGDLTVPARFTWEWPHIIDKYRERLSLTGLLQLFEQVKNKEIPQIPGIFSLIKAELDNYRGWPESSVFDPHCDISPHNERKLKAVTIARLQLKKFLPVADFSPWSEQ